jgi:hypothetical protein
LLPEFLKSRWTLAYLPQWKSDALTLVHQVCDLSELKLLCLLGDEFKRTIVVTANSRNSIILTDELSENSSPSFSAADEEKLNLISTKIFELMISQKGFQGSGNTRVIQ